MRTPRTFTSKSKWRTKHIETRIYNWVFTLWSVSLTEAPIWGPDLLTRTMSVLRHFLVQLRTLTSYIMYEKRTFKDKALLSAMTQRNTFPSSACLACPLTSRDTCLRRKKKRSRRVSPKTWSRHRGHGTSQVTQSQNLKSQRRQS